MKLYHEQVWVIPGKQGRGAERVDVPSSPADLAAWLNERQVSPEPCNTQLASEQLEALEELQPLNEPAEDLLEITKAKLRAKIAGHCPECGRSAAGTLKLQLGNDIGELEAWLEDRNVGDLW